MSKCLTRNWHLLHYLTDKDSSTKLVGIIIKNSDSELINAFTEVFFNLFNGVPPLDPKIYNKSKQLFNKLGRKSGSLRTRKHLLIRTRKDWRDPVKRALETLKDLCS